LLKKEPQQQRSRALVDTILDAATRILSSRPLREVTTNHLAEVAGVSIGSLYQYFGSKEAIVQSLLDRHRDDSVAFASRVFVDSPGRPVTERYLAVLRELLCMHEREVQLHRALMEVHEPPVSAQTDALIGEHLSITAGLLREEFPRLDGPASALHARLIMGSVHTLIHNAIRLGLPQADRTVVEHFNVFVGSYRTAVAAGSGRNPPGSRRPS